MILKLSDDLAEKAASLSESSYGTCVVTLMLSDGRRIENVILAWGSEIVRIEDRKVNDTADLNFDMNEIIDVIPFSR